MSQSAITTGCHRDNDTTLVSPAHDTFRPMTLTAAPTTVTPVTPLRLLIGDREAILALARSRWTLAIGTILVLAAGFAREFDQEDLLAKPWYLVIPFAASTVVAFLVFLVTRRWRSDRAFGP